MLIRNRHCYINSNIVVNLSQSVMYFSTVPYFRLRVEIYKLLLKPVPEKQVGFCCNVFHTLQHEVYSKVTQTSKTRSFSISSHCDCINVTLFSFRKDIHLQICDYKVYFDFVCLMKANSVVRGAVSVDMNLLQGGNRMKLNRYSVYKVPCLCDHCYLGISLLRNQCQRYPFTI